MTALTQVRIRVHGRVQGVFYRKYTQRAAQTLEVTGWVRNESSGDVEILAEGTADQVRALEKWCHTGSPKSRVSSVTVTPVTAHTATTRQFASFDIVS